jgi:hypothetical protein
MAIKNPTARGKPWGSGDLTYGHYQTVGVGITIITHINNFVKGLFIFARNSTKYFINHLPE